MLTPAIVMLATLKAALPGLLSVMLCAVVVLPMASLPKARLEVEKLALGAAAPVPERLTVWTPPMAVLVTLSTAAR